MARRLPNRKQQTVALAFSIRCADVPATEFASDDDAKWMHVATEGLYLGYRGGSKPFSLTRLMFDQAVRNVHQHPQFRAGTNGVGTADVIPWDFDHASEQDPSDGAKPALGAPAQGWVLDLRVQDGPDGKAQLHALTRFLELARTYVKGGQYKWASIAASFNATDPVTNQQLGMVLTSIALTNQPFLQNLEALVASADRGAAVETTDGLQLKYYYASDTLEEALGQLKDLFGLPATSGIAEMLAENNKVRTWVDGGTAPLGVDVDCLVDGIRKIFGMDLLEPIAAVLDKVPAIAQRLIEEKALEAGDPVPMAAPKPGTGDASMTELLKFAAGKFGVREHDDVVRASIADHADLRGALIALLGCKDDAKAILTAATEHKVAAAGAAAELAALLTALGCRKPEDAVERIATLTAALADFEKAKPELEQLRAKAVAELQAAAERDVDAVLLAKKWDPSLKDALLMQRKANPDDFAKRFPLPAPSAVASTQPAVRASLTQPLVTAGNGHQLSAARAATAVGQRGAGQQVDDGGAVNLSTYPGRNKVEQAMAHLSKTMGDAFNNLSWDAKCKAAFDFNRQNDSMGAVAN